VNFGYKLYVVNLMFAILECYNINREYTNASIYSTTILFIYIKVVYCQGDMFRLSLGHPQAFKENIYVILDLFSLRA